MASSRWNSPYSIMGLGDTPTGDDMPKSTGLYTYQPTGQTQQTMADNWARQQQDLAMAQQIEEAKRRAQPQVQYGSDQEMGAAAGNARRTVMTPAGGGDGGGGSSGHGGGDERTRRAMLLLGSIMSRRNPDAPQFQDLSGERAALNSRNLGEGLVKPEMPVYSDQAQKNTPEGQDRVLAQQRYSADLTRYNTEMKNRQEAQLRDRAALDAREGGSMDAYLTSLFRSTKPAVASPPQQQQAPASYADWHARSQAPRSTESFYKPPGRSSQS